MEKNNNNSNSAIIEKIIGYNGHDKQLAVNDLLGVSYDDLLAEINKIKNGWHTMNSTIVENNLQIGDTWFSIGLSYNVKRTREIKGNQVFVTETYTYTVTVFGDKKYATRHINLTDRSDETNVVNAITDAILETLGLAGMKIYGDL